MTGNVRLMATAQVSFSAEELLADPDLAEPLVVNDVRCHGGFDSDGTYRSPRTRSRVPAIAAWEAQRQEQFSTPSLDMPIEAWPETFPNVDQTKLLLRHGVREPTIGALTRIGTVEGFGSMLRLLPLPDWRNIFEEDIDGTATAHLGGGLFEAHARDEAGHEDLAGHDTMWFLARDVAFESPPAEDETEAMLERMGIRRPGTTGAGSAGSDNAGGSGGGADRPGDAAERFLGGRLLPDDIDPLAELVVRQMISLLFIELSAFHSFRWAEEVLSDTDLLAGEGEAARIVSYIRADETPHVAYLRVALSEMRDRTWTGASGRRHSGNLIVDRLWDELLDQSRGERRQDLLQVTWREIDRAVARRRDRDDLLEEFWSLGSVERLEDGSFVDHSDTRR